jgi:DnaJ-class molecular chaperone
MKASKIQLSKIRQRECGVRKGSDLWAKHINNKHAHIPAKKITQCDFCKGQGSLYLNMRFTICYFCNGNGFYQVDNEGKRI